MSAPLKNYVFVYVFYQMNDVEHSGSAFSWFV